MTKLGSALLDMSTAPSCVNDEITRDVEADIPNDNSDTSRLGENNTEILGTRPRSKESSSEGHSYSPVGERGEVSIPEDLKENFGEVLLPIEDTDGCADPLALKAKCDALQVEIDECRSRESILRAKMVWIEKENRALVREREGTGPAVLRVQRIDRTALAGPSPDPYISLAQAEADGWQTQRAFRKSSLQSTDETDANVEMQASAKLFSHA